MPDVAAPSSKSNEKLLLIAAFIQGKSGLEADWATNLNLVEF